MERYEGAPGGGRAIRPHVTSCVPPCYLLVAISWGCYLCGTPISTLVGQRGESDSLPRLALVRQPTHVPPGLCGRSLRVPPVGGGRASRGDHCSGPEDEDPAFRMQSTPLLPPCLPPRHAASRPLSSQVAAGGGSRATTRLTRRALSTEGAVSHSPSLHRRDPDMLHMP